MGIPFFYSFESGHDVLPDNMNVFQYQVPPVLGYTNMQR